MDAGIFLVKLEVRATNMNARKFYESLGYRELDVVRGYYEGQEDAIRMRRDLGVLVR